MIQIITTRRVRALQQAMRRANASTEQALVLNIRLQHELDDLSADLVRVRTEAQLAEWARERAVLRWEGARTDMDDLVAEVARLMAIADGLPDTTPPNSHDVPAALAVTLLQRVVAEVRDSGDPAAIERLLPLSRLFADATDTVDVTAGERR